MKYNFKAQRVTILWNVEKGKAFYTGTDLYLVVQHNEKSVIVFNIKMNELIEYSKEAARFITGGVFDVELVLDKEVIELNGK